MDAKKKAPGFMVATLLGKGKGDDKEPEGYDEEEAPAADEADDGDDPDMAMADAGRKFREAFEAKDDLGIAQAVAEIADMHGEMAEAKK